MSYTWSLTFKCRPVELHDLDEEHAAQLAFLHPGKDPEIRFLSLEHACRARDIIFWTYESIGLDPPSIAVMAHAD